jgi:hypothetical protein
LLADAVKQVFELQTQRKETQHKIDRLRDYERQIEQHIRMQRLWFDFFTLSSAMVFADLFIGMQTSRSSMIGLKSFNS